MNRVLAKQAPWLVQTKLHPPQVRGDIVLRYRLSSWLSESAAQTPITLIAAPAGYGKTTLLTSLPPALPQWRFAWLTLDEEENDANNFLFGLIAALQTAAPNCGLAALELLPVVTNPDKLDNGRAEIRRVAGVLINEIQTAISEPFFLVLDDLHFINQPLPLAALDFILERMPPQMHVVMASRREPPLSLSRFRARQRLAELRLMDLRFTVAETESLLNKSLHLNVPALTIETLQSRTEGWAAGLSLLANSLERMPESERSAFINQLSQTHQHIFDYLSDEVLRQQPPAVQTFLLQTSILQELTPEQCTAVTQMPDTGMILEDLYRRNVFILAVDTEAAAGRVYRYHALFAEFLRHRLLREMPDLIPELHRRAAMVQTTPGRAIHHFTRAKMWDEAAEAINATGEQYVWQGRLDILSNWIQQIPEATRLAHPRLAYLMGLCAVQRGETAAARRWLDEALTQAVAHEDRTTEGAALTTLGSVAFVELNFEETVQLVTQALSYPLLPYMRVQSLMARASVALFTGNWPQAAADLEHSLTLVAEDADRVSLLALMLFLGQEFTLLPDGLSRIESFCASIQSELGETIRPIRLGIADVMAFIHLRRGRLHEAIGIGKQALAIKEQLGGYYPFLGMNAAMTVAAAKTALGQYEKADQYLHLLTSAVGALPLNEHTVANGLFPLARTYWLQGRMAEVEEVHAEMRARAEFDESPQAEVLRIVVSSFLQLEQRRFDTAVETLTQAVNLAEQAPLTSVFVCPQLHLAYAYQQWAKPDAALEVFVPVLARCQVDGTPGIILQEGQTAVPLLKLAIKENVQAAYAQELLDKLSPKPGTALQPDLPGHITPLTMRELEVLQLMATGASNKSIADQLVISLPTVKSHVSHILSKLDVSSRGEAVARAHTLNLI